MGGLDNLSDGVYKSIEARNGQAQVGSGFLGQRMKLLEVVVNAGQRADQGATTVGAMVLDLGGIGETGLLPSDPALGQNSRIIAWRIPRRMSSLWMFSS